MSEAKKIKVRTKLSLMAFRDGGISSRDALRKADESMAGMRDICLAAIDEALVEMETRFGSTATSRDAAPVDDLYMLASAIIDVSVSVRDTGIDLAAKALCELVDLSGEMGLWDWVAVDLHLSTLRLLRTSGAAMSEPERRAVLDGLLKVTRKRIGDPKNLPDRAANS